MSADGDIFSLLPPDLVGRPLLTAALTHRSASAENYERLEYLGDAVLGLVVAETIFARLPDSCEGDLSRMRASLVNYRLLSELAREWGLGNHLNLGQGELKSGGARRDSILADALEALIGAVYLECGLDEARRFIVGLFGKRLEELPDPEGLKDPKTRLQEFLQGRSLNLPSYEVVSTSGKEHDRWFQVRCLIEELGVEGRGEGRGRRQAEQAAAAAALAEIADRTEDGRRGR